LFLFRKFEDISGSGMARSYARY